MVATIPKNEIILGKEFPAKVIPLIRSAQHSIRILVFDWRWYPDFPDSPVQLFNQAIVQAKRRGLKVQAVINMADVVKQLRDLGVEARKIYSKDLLHSKVMIIDEQVAILGSHNYTQSAFGKNFEVSYILTEPEEVKKLTEYFDVIFSYHGESRSI
jgi:phosphatidylserine/phosphatidylglycerophosphate/cardiolipin synthase-like enzyme